MWSFDQCITTKDMLHVVAVERHIIPALEELKSHSRQQLLSHNASLQPEDSSTDLPNGLSLPVHSKSTGTAEWARLYKLILCLCHLLFQHLLTCCVTFRLFHLATQLMFNGTSQCFWCLIDTCCDNFLPYPTTSWHFISPCSLACHNSTDPWSVKGACIW